MRHVTTTRCQRRFGARRLRALVAAGIASDSLAAVIQVGSTPTGVAVTPDGNHLYVVNNQAASVTVIDTRIATVTHTVPVDVLPQYVAVSPDGATTYVSHTSPLANVDGTVT